MREEGFERPPEFDPLAYVNQALATTPGIWATEVLLHTTLVEAERQIPAVMGILEPEADGVALTCYVQDLDWFAHFLAGLTCSLQVRRPAELRTALQSLAAKITSF
jgi:hypothetical protein